MRIKFVAQIEPIPFKRPRFGCKKQVFNEARYTEFKAELGIIARAAMQKHLYFNELLTGAIRLSVDFYKIKPKNMLIKNWGDIDNHVKAVMDALTGICYADDSQVTEIHAAKHFGEPRIEITLEELK